MVFVIESSHLSKHKNSKYSTLIGCIPYNYQTKTRNCFFLITYLYLHNILSMTDSRLTQRARSKGLSGVLQLLQQILHKL